MQGSPCGEQDDISVGEVELKIGADVTGFDCGVNQTLIAGGTMCAHLFVKSGFDDSKLKIISQELTSDQNEGPLSSSVLSTTHSDGAVGHEFTGSYTTLAENEGATLTLVVFWEQELSNQGRRMLRSEVKFGAGDSESHASIKILPAAVQIEDKVSGDAAFQPQPSDATSTSAAVDTADATFVIAICALVASVLAVVMFLSRYFTVGVRSYQPVRTSESRFKSKIDF